MSHAAMTWAVKQKCGSAAAKLVLMMLADHANGHTGRCNPSQKLLAAEAEMSVSAMKVHIKKLADKGLLTVVPVFVDGVHLPNQYDLNLAGGPSESGGGVRQNLAGGPSESGGGVRQNLAGGPSESGGGVRQNLATSNQEVKPGIKPQDTLQVHSDSDNASADEDKVIGTLPCICGADYEVKRSLYDKLEATYPCANVLDELRKMKFWLETTPNRKPSKQGMTRFIGSWMCKAHDAGRTRK